MATPIPQNHCRFTLAEVARATAGRLSPDDAGAATVRGVSIDSRTIEPGALFVALKGAAHDGHRYLADVAKRGGAAAMVNRGRDERSIRCVEVDETLAALGDLARFHLERERAWRAIPSIAIAGSAGKTTTKEILAALVRALFGQIAATPGNLNNLAGVPMTLFTLAAEHRALVIECGTNMRGEIARLGAILRPDAALLLNVDLEHSEGLGTVDEIADEEASIFRFTSRTVVVPAEDSRVLARIPAALNKISFGESAAADVRIAKRSATSRGRSRIEIELARARVGPGSTNRLEAELQLVGAQSALNAAAAVAGAAALWPTPLGESELARMRAALAGVEPVAGRLSIANAGGMLIVDDSYNSNPRSVRAALEAAREIADELGGRLVIAMGDMLELGAISVEAHAQMLREIARAKPAQLVAVGPELAAACLAASAAGDSFAAAAVLVADSEEASRAIGGIVRAGDVLLVKGSRGMRMERVVESLRRE